MTRPRSNSKPAPPKYRDHKARNLAVVTIRQPDGTRKNIYLGRYGSPESRAEYARIIAELEAAHTPAAVLVGGRPAPDVTVNEVLLAFLRHAAAYYRGPDGKPTSQVAEFTLAVKPVKALYGHAPAREFGPLAFKAVRATFACAGPR